MKDLPNCWIHIAGFLSALLYLWLAILSQEYVGLPEFLLASTICFFISVLVWWLYWRLNKQPAILSVLLWALIFRAIAVLLGEPVLEDDHFRYLWDGYQLATTGNPYGFAPEAFFEDGTLGNTFESILGNINNPHLATIYGPLCQYVFGLAYWIAPGQVWPLQLIFAGFDMALIVLLLKIAAPRQVLLYAWSPLIVKEFAFTAHTDVLAVFFMFFAWQLASSHNKNQQAFIWIPVLMALAVAAKVFAVLLLPFLLRLDFRRWLVFFASLSLLYLPFLIQDGFFAMQGLSAMTGVWLFNAPIYIVFLALFGDGNITWLRHLLLALFVMLYLFWLWRDLNQSNPSNLLMRWMPFKPVLMKFENRLEPSVRAMRPDWLYRFFLLVIPALNPWYLVWLLPFAVLKPSLWAWTASFSLLLAYVMGLHLTNSDLQAYQQPAWILAVEYGCIALALMIDRRLHRRNQCRLIDKALTKS